VALILLVEIKAENLNDSKRTALDTDSLVIVDSAERAYTPCGHIFFGKSMAEGRVYMDTSPGNRVISNIYVYGIEKSATGLKLRAFDTPAIVLDLNPNLTTNL